MALKRFKLDNGVYDFPALLSIPDRLPAMAKKDYQQASDLVVAAVTMALESMNLARPMSEGQILDLADAILDSSCEDYLSLEDLLLFLQGLTRGKYGPLYESMDIPKFMEKFEMYRQQRHEQYQQIKENKHIEYSSLGDKQRTGSKLTAMDEHLSQFTTKLAEKRDEIQELRAENRRLRDQNNF